MKVAIAGYGLEGEHNYSYWQSAGHDVTIHDEKEIPDRPLPSGAASALGSGTYDNLADYDLVVRTAGLPPRKLVSAKHVWSATNEFFEKCPAPIIGVTGTKGKGTTASFIAAILRAAGKTVHLVGNIGVPALTELADISPDDIVVYELSSFQLWDLEKSPQVSVVLMIETDHLDVHADMDEYVGAKSSISKYQTEQDLCVYHPTNEYAARIASSSAGTKVRYSVPDDGQAYVKENTFIVQNQALCTTDAVQLPGSHNLDNACAAISAALRFTDDAAAIERGLRSFSGLPHRLKHVRTVRGVEYYDDSIATTPGSALAAIRAFAKPKLIILGGKDKGADYRELLSECRESGTQVLAIGANGAAIASLCRETGVTVTDATGKSMTEIVSQAQQLADDGSVVILSPAASSFDMFKSYADRGDQFVTAVEALS